MTTQEHQRRRYKSLPQLRKWMDDRGLTQHELAEMLGITQPQVSKYLSGRRSPSLETIVVLANITGIDIEKLSNRPATSRILKLLGNRANSHARTLRENATVI
jgi:transcriptional regulator with XRE-family HTH domain